MGGGPLVPDTDAFALISVSNIAKVLAIMGVSGLIYVAPGLRAGDVGSVGDDASIPARLDSQAPVERQEPDEYRGPALGLRLLGGAYPDDPTATAELQHLFPLYPPDVDVEVRADDDGYHAADLFADRGTLFVAVTSGVIEAVGHEDNWDPDVDDPISRSGKYVSLVADDGFRYFGGHLERVESDLEPGMRVRAGQALGTVGNSGDARTQETHLHFAISGLGNWGVRPVQFWPYRVLELWEKGDLLATPDFETHTYPLARGIGKVERAGEGPAVNIFAPEGTAYLAPVAGVIETVNRTDDWDLLVPSTTTAVAPESSQVSEPSAVEVGNPEGMFVTLLGDDGFRYYASHLGSIGSGIRPGIKVEVARKLGTVGRSGNVRDEPPRLYFAVGSGTDDGAPSPPGDHDPAALLEAWRTGRVSALPGTVGDEQDDEAGPPLIEHAYPVVPASSSDYSAGGHNYPATDIFARTGTEVVAPVPGVIERIAHQDFYDPDLPVSGTRGGVFVAILGDDGFRYYMSHLDEAESDLSAGLRVQVGDRLGTVGQTGSAAGKEAHVHFDISPSDDWDERLGRRDPFAVLEAWRNGERGVNPNTVE